MVAMKAVSAVRRWTATGLPAVGGRADLGITALLPRRPTPHPEVPMIRATSLTALSAALLLGACGGGDRSAAAPADSVATAKADADAPGTLIDAPARAQAAVDSANAASARREAEVGAAGGAEAGSTGP